MAWPRWLRGGRLLVALVVAIVALVTGARLAASALIEILWHGQTGYVSVFWKRALWQWGIRTVAGALVAAAAFLNLRIVSGTLGGIQIKRRFGNLEISEQLPRSYVFWAMIGIAGLLGLWFGAAVPGSVGIQALLLANGSTWGLSDPVLSRDIGFYVFWVPVLGSGVTFALVVTFLLFTLATGGYAATGALRWDNGRLVTHDVARVHLGALVAVFLLLLGCRLYLGRFLLLLDGSSNVQGIFGYADAQARLPALQTMTVVCVLAAVGALWSSWHNRGIAMIVTLLAAMVASFVIGQVYPAMVQRFRVEPNELEREAPYIGYNMEFTRRGFGLDALERRPFDLGPNDPVDWVSAARQFAGLPMWNQGTLLTTYRELEARFPYYDFTDVTVDRYPSAEGPVPVAVAVREIDPAGIQDPNWQNLHLRERYIAGLGAVASLAASRTEEGRPPMALSGIPPDTTTVIPRPLGLGLSRPQIYFGSRPQRHAIINPSDVQFLAPDGTPGQAGVDYPEGIRLSSPLRTLAIAWRFRDANLLFASEVGSESRFIYRRLVLERVAAVAPFLRYFQSPYPVVSNGRVVWLVEGFTATRAFPLASAHDRPGRRALSYVRNSVKVTVDAVSGAMHFYRVPVHDPLADAYERAFPDLFRPIEEMPGDLRRHVRYSRELLSLQAQVLLQYHQETAPAFHGQQDVWALPNELAQGTSPVPYRPEYGIWTLPGESEPRFNLTTVFVPAGRQNLTAILVARTDDAGVPELVRYDVPVDDQVAGPRQIEALVEQDPMISQQFSLWRTGGSEVWTGHLHLVPSGRRILYVEPVFLAAEADAIPELRRFVVSDGRRVAMTETIAQAIETFSGNDLATDQTPGETVSVRPSGQLPRAALDLLERAESLLRVGDWAGFGAALAELRALLREAAGPSGEPRR
jgi:uncharacterized membrane protein (UPF0182 family)